MWNWIYMTVLYMFFLFYTIVNKTLLSILLYFVNKNIVKKQSHSWAALHLIVFDTALFRLWMNLCFWTNLVSQWFNDPFI